MTGQEMYQLAARLYPLNRSLTGAGTRQTLDILREVLPALAVKSVPSGTKCFDWTVPDEWNVWEAHIEDPDGNLVVDLWDHNLHVVGYSTPIDAVLSLDELQTHLHSRPDMPDAIPYVTSYYKRNWGFCLPESKRQELKPGQYKVSIQSTLKPGVMHYGELIIPGETTQEVLLSTYVCHPSMANDGTSGIVVTSALAQWVSEQSRRYTYRILFVPETIGAIAYLSMHREAMMQNTVAGFVVTCCGDDRGYSMVASPSANTLADRVAFSFMPKSVCGSYRVDTTGSDGITSSIEVPMQWSYFTPNHWATSPFPDPFVSHRGSDERQYCSPGVNLPVVALMRSGWHGYREYHTSADDMSVISPIGLQGGYDVLQRCLEIIERNHVYRPTCPCEPFLERHGLYSRDLMDVIACCDGRRDIVAIAEVLGKLALDVAATMERLRTHGILEVVA